MKSVYMAVSFYVGDWLTEEQDILIKKSPFQVMVYSIIP